ncbi:MAG: recombination protein RecR [Mollicutes bacterium]|jgi:recombination protein RecR|nr:recombination protein RecR [Mollicutes bacterium]
MVYPEVLESVIEYFKKFPGVGDKTAERMALSVLELTEEEISQFSEILVKSKKDLQICEICGHLTDKEICHICDDETRDPKTICVVEDYKSVFVFEKTGNFNGKYHVLGGLISPVDRIFPEDINISSLVSRCENLENVELIVALKPTIEGETTTLYLKKIFEDKNISISRLSYGIPMGAEIDYLDSITLDRALQDRKQI